jgi:hypothetical protein
MTVLTGLSTQSISDIASMQLQSSLLNMHIQLLLKNLIDIYQSLYQDFEQPQIAVKRNQNRPVLQLSSRLPYHPRSASSQSTETVGSQPQAQQI